MAYDKLVDSTQLNSDLEDVADAIRAKSGGSSQLAFPSGFVSEIGNISTGASVADGIVVKTRDSNGKATEVDFYGTTIQAFQFFNQNSNNGAWQQLETINYKNTVTHVKNNAFMYCAALTSVPPDVVTIDSSAFSYIGGVQNISLPNLTSLGTASFYSCTALKTLNLPKLTNCGYNNIFGACTALESVTIGSEGHTVTSVSNSAFVSDTQSGLTITVYTNGTYADTIKNNIRNKATNATIIIKASEATTYGGTSYNAGDTMLTSTPT